MSDENEVKDKIELVTCYSCGIAFSFAKKIASMWKESHKTFYCPNGHSLCWSGETAEQKEMKSLKEQVAELQVKLTTATDNIAEKTKKLEALSSELEIWMPRSAKEEGA